MGCIVILNIRFRGKKKPMVSKFYLNKDSITLVNRNNLNQLIIAAELIH